MKVFFLIYGWDLFLFLIRLFLGFMLLGDGISNLNNWNDALSFFSSTYRYSFLSPAWLLFISSLFSILCSPLFILGKYVKSSCFSFIMVFFVFQIPEITMGPNPLWLFFIIPLTIFGGGKINLDLLKKL